MNIYWIIAGLLFALMLASCVPGLLLILAVT